MSKKDLEETVREKVSPLLGETMEKSLGLKIPKLEMDITDHLLDPQLDIYIKLDVPFKKSKKLFKKEFLKRELKHHLGNISQLAKVIGMDRRSLHRAIKNLKIDIDQLRDLELKEEPAHVIDEQIRLTLDQYKSVLHPQRIEKMYEQIPTLSRNIAKLLPSPHLTWKEAEDEFEKYFLGHALLETNWNITQAAQKIELRVETLHRKIKQLELKRV